MPKNKTKINIIGLILLIALVSCNKEKEFQAPSDSNKLSTQGPNLENKLPEIDILEPEVKVDEQEEYFQGDLFDLWSIFFKSFVAVTNQSPRDTRVDFKLLHQLRSQKDKDFLNLVSIIEEKMASTDLRGKPTEYKAAFYINTYNYSAVRLANKGYLDKDAKAIESLLKLSTGVNPFEILSRKAIALRQGIVSLDELQKIKLKEVFSDGEKQDARYLLALNSVALTKAPILETAYRPEKLDEQLTFAARNAFQIKRIAFIENDKLELSRLFKWYKKAFEADSGSIEGFAQKYGIEKKDYKKIRYQNFSWDLPALASFSGNVVEERDQKLPVIRDEDVLSDDNSKDVVEKGPCDYLESETVKVLGQCTQIIEGVQDGAYKYESEVRESSLCLYTRKLEGGLATLGIMGDITVKDVKSGDQDTHKLAIEGEYKKRKEVLQTKVTEEMRTRLQYSPGSKQLGVRQTSVIIGRGYRKFLLQCN